MTYGGTSSRVTTTEPRRLAGSSDDEPNVRTGDFPLVDLALAEGWVYTIKGHDASEGGRPSLWHNDRE